ncbi:hypothetical protein EDC05_004351, partial [Coemansia umbellata]
MDPNAFTNNNNNSNNQAPSSGPPAGSRADDFALSFSQAASMFMGSAGTGGSGADSGLDDLWGMGDATNLFFNMDAFSSAPASAVGNGPAQSSFNAANNTSNANAASSGGAGGIDLAALGFDMAGASMDPDAWRMLLQGDPSMDDLLGGFGASAGGQPLATSNPSAPGTVNANDTQLGASSAAAAAAAAAAMMSSATALPTSMLSHAAPAATLVPADLDALSKNPAQQQASLKSPTPTAKKPRQTKPKKPAAPKGEKAAKSKASRKGATPKLKSPTPQPNAATDSLPTSQASGSSDAKATLSPSAEAVRRIKPKAEGGVAASPTPSAKSASGQGQQQPAAYQLSHGASATPTGMLNGQMPQQNAFVSSMPGQNVTNVSTMQAAQQQQQPQSLQQQAQHNAFLMQQHQQQQQQQQAFLLQQQQLLQSQAIQGLAHLSPAQRAQFIQQLQAAGGPANQALLVALQQQAHQAQQQVLQQKQVLQQQHVLQQQASSAGNALAGLQASA